MTSNNGKINIFIILVLTIILPIILGSLLKIYFPTNYISIPLHSGLEVAGGVMAIVISMIFYIKYLTKHILTHFNYTTIALLTMGIIDIFHGIVMPGKLFVWLHSSAVFFGGILFVTIWLEHKSVSLKTYRLIPIVTVIMAILFSIISCVFSDMLPPMLNEDKTFTTTANFLNLVGGIGFFIASVKFLKEYIVTNDIEELLLAGHTLLFGIAGVLFVTSVIWDVQWWLWHFLRLMAYVIALYFLYIEFDKEIHLLENTNFKLDEANKKINKYLKIVDQNIITSSSDLEGNILDVSEAFCKISGYSKEELIGQKHNLVKHPDMDPDIYITMWETLLNNQTWVGEIKNKKKGGDYYWVKASIYPIFNDDGKKIGYTAIRQDITDKKVIEEISITDGLTGIYNRRHFNELFPKIINSAKRKNELVSFTIMDVDHFKQYNDTYGHQMGDEVLIQVVNAIQNSLHRADDYSFRLGGEEFGVIFKSDTQEKAYSFANTIRKNIEKLHIVHGGNSVSDYVTVSMGVICENANNMNNINELYKRADDLLYKAKESGRNKICH